MNSNDAIAAGPLVYIVAGEDSGDALGADLAVALRQLQPVVRFAGVAGRRMQGQGIDSLFDIADISVMGVSAVLARLPTLIQRISQTARDIVARNPDVLVLIDSPDFNRRVAQRVRKAAPAIPIVKYVCPQVWAWRPGRARQMASYIDHVLALLPFEPELLAGLGGPPATYVGHPLASKIAPVIQRPKPSARKKTLLVLPGSRRAEIGLLLPDIGATLAILHERGNRYRVLLPAVPHLEKDIREAVAGWPVKPDIVSGEEAKREAFERADAALATSGTVILELALHRVPTVSIYRLDRLMHLFRFLITGWTAALPNLIADEAIIPERVGDMVRPGWLARAIEALMRDGPERQAQLAGFEKMAAAMATPEAPGLMAARKVLEIAKGSKKN